MGFQAFPYKQSSKVPIIIIFTVAVLTVVFSAEPYQQESVDQHNLYRRRYGTPPLSMSEELNEAAVKCAEFYAEIGSINHNCPYTKVANFSGEPGENLYYFGGGGMTYSKIGGGAGYSWWKEHKNYNLSNIKFSHFTQQIWKRTTHMGIGVHPKKGSNLWYACALYFPPGNVVGGQKSNLMPRDESVKE